MPNCLGLQRVEPFNKQEVLESVCVFREMDL